MSVIRREDHTTDPESRILGLTESVAGSASAAWTYGYDLADRLTDALVSPGGAYGYDLDPGDNPLGIQTPASATTTSYGNLNQIALRNGQPFTWDAAGNLADDGQRTYAWDAEQRLIRIRYTGTSKATEFRYDGLGRRTSVREYTSSSNTTETRYLWCGERICQARNSSDTPIRRYYDEGEQLVTTNGNTSYYYAQDHLGSVRDLVTASGTVLASYDYDPYGNPTRATSINGARADYRYAGLFYHAPSGLYLTHYRVYDPGTARWLSRDPIGEIGGINLYGYVGGNPISFSDPYGLWAWGDPVPQPVVDYAAGFGDAASLGSTDLARDAMGTNDAVNKCSIPYSAGSWTTAAFGVGRMIYAGAARGYSMFATSGVTASAFRSSLRNVFGGGPSLRPPNVSKYDTDDALRAAAGRTNPYANAYGAGAAGAGAYGGSGCRCDP